MTRSNLRFGSIIERNDDADFPFYNLLPQKVETWKWLAIILASVAGFAALSFIGFESQVLMLIPRILFVGLPLATFIILVQPNWRAIFRPLKARDYGAMIIFWLINLLVSALVALIASGGKIGGFTSNSATDGLVDGGVINVVAFYLGTFLQLFGEEVFTILPFLAVLYWCYSKAHLSRKTSIILAWIITAVWFGAAHLPTYGWNFVQAIFVIGSARIVLTLAFIRTKNILVSFGAHLINDWATFTFALVFAALAAS
ncbi:CPBP family intramembrane glutamic endopeptidase [Glutamicibacter sp.]|uniref:CPBP family intramembrane glutamic endopeptidase n=1 Tax=Glutamicibacter sp. TaxID=1931995 RepID=UPI0028BF0676|nr:CPBP family intramembrane glutamic endopeptidase [Glutamicibacter sp.]